MAQLVKNPPALWETWVLSWVGQIPWRGERLSTPVFWPGEFHGLYRGHRELDTTERLSPSREEGLRAFKDPFQWLAEAPSSPVSEIRHESFCDSERGEPGAQHLMAFPSLP